MGSWHSPQSIYGLGHKAIADIFTVPVQLQEKVDGSFFAFGYYPDDESGYPWKLRSKSAIMSVEAPQAMFKLAVETVKGLQDKLTPNWQYRGEVLCKPRHNALAYERVPVGNVILFDICRGEEDYLSYDELKLEGERLGLEVVPQLFSGKVRRPDELRAYLDTVSILGGQKIEGVVIKPLAPMFDRYQKKLLMGKFVSEAFKEVHKEAWKGDNPTTGDIIDKLVKGLKTTTRWNKSIQHRDERGELVHAPQDIGPLVGEIIQDIKTECEDEIKDALFKYAWKHIARRVTDGFPQFYKDKLLERQFENESRSESADLKTEGEIADYIDSTIVGESGNLQVV